MYVLNLWVSFEDLLGRGALEGELIGAVKGSGPFLNIIYMLGMLLWLTSELH